MYHQYQVGSWCWARGDWQFGGPCRRESPHGPRSSHPCLTCPRVELLRAAQQVQAGGRRGPPRPAPAPENSMETEGPTGRATLWLKDGRCRQPWGRGYVNPVSTQSLGAELIVLGWGGLGNRRHRGAWELWGGGCLEALAAGGGELEPSKQAVRGGEALGGLPPPCLPLSSPQRNSSSCSKASRPSKLPALPRDRCWLNSHFLPASESASTRSPPGRPVLSQQRLFLSSTRGDQPPPPGGAAEPFC